MILDSENMYSIRQDITSSAVSESVIDHGSNTEKVSAYHLESGIEVFALVGEDFAGCSYVKAQLETSDTENFATKEIIHATDKIAVAKLSAGYSFRFGKLPAGIKRYTRMYYTVTGTATAGKITSGLNIDRQTSGLR